MLGAIGDTYTELGDLEKAAEVKFSSTGSCLSIMQHSACHILLTSDLSDLCRNMAEFHRQVWHI